MAQASNFIICRTCGRYVQTVQPVKAGFCSDFCAQKYGCCITCGRYSLKENMFKEEFCSQDCSIQYEMKEPVKAKSVAMQMRARAI